MNYWPKCLTYGNWGAPSWSGGEFVHDPSKVDWSVKPIDSMDDAFKRHDWAIQHGVGALAHKMLANELRYIAPPTSLYGKLYRYAAIGIFTVLGLFA